MRAFLDSASATAGDVLLLLLLRVSAQEIRIRSESCVQ
jgi:hypothetical protein